MNYRIEMLVSKKGRIKIWRQVHGKGWTRNEAITEASKISRPGKIRIRRISKPRKPGGATSPS